MGNPHAVIYVDDVKGLDLEKSDQSSRIMKDFPKRINTEFCALYRQTDGRDACVGTWLGVKPLHVEPEHVP